ncbi:phage portal protein, lambda family [Longilinea arvoryzae]|uniref:Phage portal protein, lambda family n=1 Tax=Longilinea arvoryzae TaxID=360412 RepID=A0A0S7BFT1_9CHLR|nr:hypothetical protein [Longilinea arvoryzae]GAP12898.1 phage portal protein, lambda family [Longilinea arvoryzae]
MPKRPLFTRFQSALRAFFQTTLIEPEFYEGAAPEQRDRAVWDRAELLRQALEAWRSNPLARRIVELTSQYVVGGGFTLASPDPQAHDFLQEWWRHPLNQAPLRVFEWCDELTRSGELFFLLSSDAAGMTYLRAVPALAVRAVHTAENDVQQETAYELEGGEWGESLLRPAYNPLEDTPDAAVMVHYAANRPVGALRGESDLAPLLRWLARYAAWLEDRARLNRFRTSFVYVIKARFAGEAERRARQQMLAANPPTPGSFLVTDESESWETLSPRLEADDAANDGLALKKMIAAGAGLPLHFLAEPESSTRTTAESAGGPTFRHFEQCQELFRWLVGDLARIALHRRACLQPGLNPDAVIEVRAADLSARDNAALAVACSTISGAFLQLYERGLIDAGELLRLCYRFAGETADVNELLKRARPRPRSRSAAWKGRPAGIKVDPVTGEVSGEEE